MIIEAASGHPWATELRRRILAPLRLGSTSFDTSPRIAATYAHGYPFLEGGLRRDMSIFSPSAPWAAGAIVSTADDVASFYRALLGGRLLRPHLLHAMRTTVPIPLDPRRGRADLGLFEIQSPCGRIRGHDGQFAGYHTLAWASRHAKRQVVVMVNADPLPDETTEEALKRLVDAAYCRRSTDATVMTPARLFARASAARGQLVGGGRPPARPRKHARRRHRPRRAGTSQPTCSLPSVTRGGGRRRARSGPGSRSPGR
jgi:CubicO group peptidase (beta-lactamase class C family)